MGVSSCVGMVFAFVFAKQIVAIRVAISLVQGAGFEPAKA